VGHPNEIIYDEIGEEYKRRNNVVLEKSWQNLALCGVKIYQKVTVIGKNAVETLLSSAFDRLLKV